MNYSEWLQAELMEAENSFTEAERQEVASGFEIEATMQRKYWEGYVDALTNCQHEDTGAGSATADDREGALALAQKKATEYLRALRRGDYFEARALGLDLHYGADLEWRNKA